MVSSTKAPLVPKSQMPLREPYSGRAKLPKAGADIGSCFAVAKEALSSLKSSHGVRRRSLAPSGMDMRVVEFPFRRVPEV